MWKSLYLCSHILCFQGIKYIVELDLNYSSCSGVDSNSDLFSCSGITELTVNTETVCPLSTSDLFSQLANLHEVLDGSE